MELQAIKKNGLKITVLLLMSLFLFSCSDDDKDEPEKFNGRNVNAFFYNFDVRTGDGEKYSYFWTNQSLGMVIRPIIIDKSIGTINIKASNFKLEFQGLRDFANGNHTDLRDLQAGNSLRLGKIIVEKVSENEVTMDISDMPVVSDGAPLILGIHMIPFAFSYSDKEGIFPISSYKGKFLPEGVECYIRVFEKL